MSDQLLDKADALMRRRSFVAGVKTTAAEPSDTPDALDIEDFPILTEVVEVGEQLNPQPGDTSAEEFEAALAQKLEAAVNDQVSRLLMERQTLLSNEIEIWLDEQMPQLVIRVMDGITDHLVALLANRTRDELLPRLEAAMKLHAEENQDSDGSE